jgi:hemoglobin
MTMDTQAARAALRYRAWGWLVVPIEPRGKRPLVRWEEFQQRLPSEAEITAWLARWPDAGVGIVTGSVSRLVVVDVDPRHGGAEALGGDRASIKKTPSRRPDARCAARRGPDRSATGWRAPTRANGWETVRRLRHVHLQVDTGAGQLPVTEPIRKEIGRMTNRSLYERLGGYDAIAAVAGDLLPRLQSDARLGRFWQNRSEDGIRREKQLLIDFLCANAGGPLYYTGRDMLTSHHGMRIDERDWSAFLGHLSATLDAFRVPRSEHDEVVAFIETTKRDIVEA